MARPTAAAATAAVGLVKRPPLVAVAASGGRDSTALLHCTARAAAALGAEVHALHVHHGLQTAADDWLAQVQAQCRRWRRSGLPLHFHSRRLVGAPAPGNSVEAWARRERYRALADMARAAGCSMVLLAHHRRDQAETFLLQALRGGGSAGLAAMPRSAQRDGVLWLRPWLEQPRSSIEAYLHRHRLSFIDDGSNADTRFARNRLRLEVWSKLTAAFADAETSLVGAARLAQEAAECLHELAAIDLAACVQAGNLQVSAWSALTLARRKNLLRAWLVAVVAGPLPDTLVQRLALELPAARIGRWPAPGGELRLFDGLLRFATAAPAIPICPHPTQLDISRPGRYVLPGWGGKLDIEAVAHGGVATAELRHVELRPRKGGERFQFTPKSLPRDLKRQYQARRVPDWQRDGPLLYSRESLLFVPGLGIDARRLAADGTPQLRLVWQPDGAAAD